MDLPICPLSKKPCLMPRHYTVTNITGKTVESINLCSLCAASYMEAEGISMGQEIKTHKAFKSFTSFLDELSKIGQAAKTPCPNCASTLSEIMESQRFGCPQCYDHFGPEVDSLVKKIQAGHTHTGKQPPKQVISPLEALKVQLAAAIAEEDYERAAKIKSDMEKL